MNARLKVICTTAECAEEFRRLANRGSGAFEGNRFDFPMVEGIQSFVLAQKDFEGRAELWSLSRVNNEWDQAYGDVPNSKIDYGMPPDPGAGGIDPSLVVEMNLKLIPGGVVEKSHVGDSKNNRS